MCGFIDDGWWFGAAGLLPADVESERGLLPAEVEGACACDDEFLAGLLLLEGAVEVLLLVLVLVPLVLVG